MPNRITYARPRGTLRRLLVALLLVAGYGGTASSAQRLRFISRRDFRLSGDIPSIPVRDIPAIAVGDFNGDGKLDVVSRDYGLTVFVSLNNGDATFQRSMQTGPGFGSGARPSSQSVAVADFNSDGNADIIITNENGDRIDKILLGKGNGTFQAPATWYALRAAD